MASDLSDILIRRARRSHAINSALMTRRTRLPRKMHARSARRLRIKKRVRRRAVVGLNLPPPTPSARAYLGKILVVGWVHRGGKVIAL
jgi:hypothetical protein